MANEYPVPHDEDLARQSQAGSLSAFDELITRYHRRIYAFVAQSCSNATDAAEITQETFIKAFQAIGSFNPRRAFAAWLFTIARRKCIDHHRATRSIGQGPMPELADWRNPADQLAQQEDRRDLWAIARAVLPDAQFQALWLKYAEEMSVEETAQVLRKTQTHVKVLLFRARRALARALKPVEIPLPVTLPDPRTNPESTAPGLQAGPVRAPLGIPMAAGKSLL